VERIIKNKHIIIKVSYLGDRRKWTYSGRVEEWNICAVQEVNERVGVLRYG
jgi:hypothetical protein